MHTRTTTAVLLAATVLLAGCTADADPKPAAPTSAPPSPSTSPTATLSLESHKAWCREAIFEKSEAQTGPVESEPRPVACLGLGDSDFLDAYSKGLMDANWKALEERKRARSGG